MMIDVSWIDYWWLISDDDRYIIHIYIYIHISYYIMIYPSCGYVTCNKQNIEPNRTTQTHQKHQKTCFSMLMLHLLICWLSFGNDTLQLLHIPKPKRKRNKNNTDVSFMFVPTDSSHHDRNMPLGPQPIDIISCDEPFQPVIRLGIILEPLGTNKKNSWHTQIK